MNSAGENNCRRRVKIWYECSSRIGCRYFKAMTGVFSGKGRCEYYMHRTGECICGAAKDAALGLDEAGDGKWGEALNALAEKGAVECHSKN
jgi:hypothetical protein